MSKLIFFIQEAFRAMRRNAAPSTAAIVTTGVTVILLGVLIPVFQTASAKSDEVRGQLNFQVAALRRRDQGRNRLPRPRAEGDPARRLGRLITKAEALEELQGRPRQGQGARN